jgi:hypothetical protein
MTISNTPRPMVMMILRLAILAVFLSFGTIVEAGGQPQLQPLPTTVVWAGEQAVPTAGTFTQTTVQLQTINGQLLPVTLTRTFVGAMTGTSVASYPQVDFVPQEWQTLTQVQGPVLDAKGSTVVPGFTDTVRYQLSLLQSTSTTTTTAYSSVGYQPVGLMTQTLTSPVLYTATVATETIAQIANQQTGQNAGPLQLPQSPQNPSQQPSQSSQSNLPLAPMTTATLAEATVQTQTIMQAQLGYATLTDSRETIMTMVQTITSPQNASQAVLLNAPQVVVVTDTNAAVVSVMQTEYQSTCTQIQIVGPNVVTVTPVPSSSSLPGQSTTTTMTVTQVSVSVSVYSTPPAVDLADQMIEALLQQAVLEQQTTTLPIAPSSPTFSLSASSYPTSTNTTTTVSSTYSSLYTLPSPTQLSSLPSPIVSSWTSPYGLPAVTGPVIILNEQMVTVTALATTIVGTTASIATAMLTSSMSLMTTTMPMLVSNLSTTMTTNVPVLVMSNVMMVASLPVGMPPTSVPSEPLFYLPFTAAPSSGSSAPFWAPQSTVPTVGSIPSNITTSAPQSTSTIVGQQSAVTVTSSSTTAYTPVMALPEEQLLSETSTPVGDWYDDANWASAPSTSATSTNTTTSMTTLSPSGDQWGTLTSKGPCSQPDTVTITMTATPMAASACTACSGANNIAMPCPNQGPAVQYATDDSSSNAYGDFYDYVPSSQSLSPSSTSSSQPSPSQQVLSGSSYSSPHNAMSNAPTPNQNAIAPDYSPPIMVGQQYLPNQSAYPMAMPAPYNYYNSPQSSYQNGGQAYYGQPYQYPYPYYYGNSNYNNGIIGGGTAVNNVMMPPQNL